LTLPEGFHQPQILAGEENLQFGAGRAASLKEKSVAVLLAE